MSAPVVKRVRERRLNAGPAPHLAPAKPLFGIAGKHAAGIHLADMREEMVEKATAARDRYDALTLGHWYQVQLSAVRGQVAELEAKLTRNLARLTDPEDPNWPKYWQQQARYAYLAQTTENRLLGRGTLPLLEDAGHVLVCPWHGIDGDVFADIPPEDWEGLACLGVLEGGLETHASWWRYCLGACAKGALELLAGDFQKHFQTQWTSGQAARAREVA